MTLLWRNIAIFLMIVIKVILCERNLSKDDLSNKQKRSDFNKTSIDIKNSTSKILKANDEKYFKELDLKNVKEDESIKLLHFILRRSDGSEVQNEQESDQSSFENDEINLFKRADFNKILGLNTSSLNSKSKTAFLFDPKLDMLNTAASKLNSNDMPLIQPAAAQLSTSPFNETNSKIRKKNFSKLAKSLLIASRMFDKKSVPLNMIDTINNNDTLKAARSFTSPKTTLQTHLRIFEIGGFCSSKSDGLYDDPDDCENFIICFADRTFRTKCSYGTKWNHVIRECDFADKVDCSRNSVTKNTAIKTSFIQTEPITKSSTIMMLPKFSNITMPNEKSKYNLNFARTFKTNMLLIITTIPAGLLLLVIIVATVIYWHNKFKNRRQKELAINMGISTITSADPSIMNSNKLDKNRQRPNVIKRLSSCCCYKKFSNYKGCHKHLRPPNLIASCSNTRSDHIRSQISSSILNKQNNSSIAYQQTQNQTSSEDLNGSSSDAGIMTTLNDVSNENTMIGNEEKFNNNEIIISNLETINNINNDKRFQTKPNECHIATGSHVTLSSHFEENNWDYNFATRGLYLSQPWVRGKYIHTLGSESMATSTVLTLDPVVADVAHKSEKKPKNLVELYSNAEGASSESDGYYA